MSGSDPSPTAPPSLPRVAVVDTDLVGRRRRVARPVQRVAAAVVGVTVAVLIGARPEGAPAGATLAVLVLAIAAVLWSLPWAGVRPPTTWYLGIEADGLRVSWALAPGGHLFLPWWAVGDVGVRRWGGIVPVLRIRPRPEGRPVFVGVDPHAVDLLYRRGLQVGLQGTSMTATQAAGLIERVRP